MCPACISAVTWWVVGSASGSGAMALAVSKWRSQTKKIPAEVETPKQSISSKS